MPDTDIFQVGPQQVPDGQRAVPRLGKNADQIASELHGRFYEQNYRGNTFVMDSDSVTLAAANTTKGALATVKLFNGFYNPPTSQVNAVLLWVGVATVSGTPAGPFFYNFLFDTTINSAATGTIRSAVLGGPAVSRMTAQTQVVLANVAGATTALKQCGTVGGPAAVAATGNIMSVYDELAGRFIVPPGCVFGLTCVGAGTTHIVQSTMFWEEVPV